MIDCSSIQRQRDAYVDLIEKQMEKSRADIDYSEEMKDKVQALTRELGGLDPDSSDPEIVRQRELLQLNLKDAEIEAKWASDRAQKLMDMINEFSAKVNEFNQQLEDCEKQNEDRPGWLRM
jgi:DNA repair exonuclease SbcCD ATPase subunit